MSKQQRGFASMTLEKRREISSKGGKACHQLGKARKWSSEEAARAGKLGGTISRRGPNKKKKVG